MPKSWAMCRHERPLARRPAILAASTAIRGRPSVLPLARALRRPARTRSTIRLRSSSATAPKTVKTIFPAGVDVSICSEKDTKSIPRALKVSKARSKCETERANRSNRQTQTTSKRRLCASAMRRLSSGRESFVPLTPASTYSPAIRQPHDQNTSNGLAPWRTTRDALAGLQHDTQEAARFPESRLKYYRLLGAGQNWRNLPTDLQKEAMGASWYAGGGKTGFYRRLAWERPSPTLVTSPTMPATDLCHPKELRPLSVTEYAAIQTFPAEYVFEGSLADRYRQIGNAVPCLFAEAIAKHIRGFDEGKLKSKSTMTRHSRYVGTDHVSWRNGAENRQEALFS